MATKPKQYCGPCDEWVVAKSGECPKCGADTEKPQKLTRMEKLQAAADAGYDTWADYRGEK